jgi:hypothetical protein
MGSHPLVSFPLSFHSLSFRLTRNPGNLRPLVLFSESPQLALICPYRFGHVLGLNLGSHLSLPLCVPSRLGPGRRPPGFLGFEARHNVFPLALHPVCTEPVFLGPRVYLTLPSTLSGQVGRILDDPGLSENRVQCEELFTQIICLVSLLMIPPRLLFE